LRIFRHGLRLRPDLELLLLAFDVVASAGNNALNICLTPLV